MSKHEVSISIAMLMELFEWKTAATTNCSHIKIFMNHLIKEIHKKKISKNYTKNSILKIQEENLAIRTKILEKLFEHSPSTGLNRIKELEKLRNILEEDFNTVRKNVERAKRLKAILEQVLDSRQV